MVSIEFQGWNDTFEPGVSDSQTANREANLHLSRHDNHNLEIKLQVNEADRAFESDLQVYFFLPHSLEPGMFSKQDHLSDFRSRSRLALTQAQPAVRGQLIQHLNTLDKMLRSSHFDENKFIKEVQETGAIVVEIIKTHREQICRKLLLVQSLFSQQVQSAQQAQPIVDLMAEVVEVLAFVRKLTTTHRENPWIQMLETFSHQNYLSFMSTLEDNLNLRQNSDEALKPVQDYLRQMIAEEKAHSRSCPDEDHLTKLGQMKKFFQSSLFVDVQKRSDNKKLQESTALAGTALAAMVAGGVQILSEVHTSNLASRSALVFTLGVVFYVFRDRLKDWSKNVLHKKATASAPDVEHNMIVHGEHMGHVQEWVKVHPTLSENSPILATRQKGMQNIWEKTLPEDVLMYRYRQACDKPLFARLQDNIRINIHRYLKLMDDPVKDVTFLDESGSIARMKSRKKYYIYAVLRQTLHTRDYQDERQVLYRIELDKTGIQTVELVV